MSIDLHVHEFLHAPAESVLFIFGAGMSTDSEICYKIYEELFCHESYFSQ